MNTKSHVDLKEWPHLSAREFMRNAAQILDDLERGGGPIVITRHSRRAVVITPIADVELRERLRRRLPAPAESRPEEEEAVAIPQVELTQVERRVLLIVAGFSPKGWLVDYLGRDAQAGFSAANMLVGHDLVELRAGRYRTTKPGWALASLIAEEESRAGEAG